MPKDTTKKEKQIETLENPNDRCECGSTNCTFEDMGGYAYPVIKRTCRDCSKTERYTDLYR